MRTWILCLLAGCSGEAPPAAPARAALPPVPRGLPYTPEHFWSAEYPGKPPAVAPSSAGFAPTRRSALEIWDGLYRESTAGFGPVDAQKVETWNVRGTPRRILSRSFERGYAWIVLDADGRVDPRFLPRVLRR